MSSSEESIHTSRSPDRGGAWVVAAILLAALPAFVFKYLPMTDLPQHLAVASVIDRLGDPAMGYADYYRVDFGNTFYWLPYAITLGLGSVLSLETAERVLVFLSMVAYPLGALAVLRALGKPLWLAFPTLLLVYNRSFFWGFINFNLAVGLAFVAIALLIRPLRGWKQTVALVSLTAAIVFTHTHGLAFLGVYAVNSFLLEPTRATFKRLLPLSPGLLGVAGWGYFASRAEGYGQSESPPFVERLWWFPEEVLGGYQDRSEQYLLVAAAVVVGLFALTRIPVTRERISKCTDAELALWLLVLLNLILYFVLPAHTRTAKFIHFRHAFLALAILPLVCSLETARQLRMKVLLPVLGLSALANGWFHLAMFDREAHDFDPVIEHVVPKPHLASLIFDANGSVMRTFPYVHFAGYLQAERGGFISSSFAKFWNVPLRFRDDAGLPKKLENFEWLPHLYHDGYYNRFYDTLLVRRNDGKLLPFNRRFPFKPVFIHSAWQVYRRPPPNAFVPPEPPLP